MLRATILKYIFCNLCDLLSGRSIFPLLGMTFHLDSIIGIFPSAAVGVSLPLIPSSLSLPLYPHPLCFTLLLLSNLSLPFHIVTLIDIKDLKYVHFGL